MSSAIWTQILAPGLTHWQSPRFFGYFATSATPPGILAELLAATLNQVAFIWRTSPASTELEQVVLGWMADLLGLPSTWHGHIEDTASTSTLAALVAARHATGRNVVVCSEQAHSASDKAARMLQMELRKAPVDSELRMRIGEVDLADVAACVATVGTTSTAAVDPVPEIADACEQAGRGSTSMPHTRARRWSAPSSGGRLRAWSGPTRSSSTRTSGWLRRWTARSCGRAGRWSSGRRSRSCPSSCGRPTTQRSISASGARRSGDGFGHSSSGLSCAATVGRDCRR